MRWDEHVENSKPRGLQNRNTKSVHFIIFVSASLSTVNNHWDNTTDVSTEIQWLWRLNNNFYSIISMFIKFWTFLQNCLFFPKSWLEDFFKLQGNKHEIGKTSNQDFWKNREFCERDRVFFKPRSITTTLCDSVLLDPIWIWVVYKYMYIP